MPNRSKTDIVERVKLLEEEVYPSGTNTPDTATAGEDGKLDLVNTGEIDIGKLVSALDVSGYDITGVGELESDSLNTGKIDSKEIPDNLTTSRSFNTWYQNTTGTDLYLSITGQVNVDGTRMRLQLDINDTQANNQSDEVHVQGDTPETYGVEGTVPVGAYYRVRASADTPGYDLRDWVEQI